SEAAARRPLAPLAVGGTAQPPGRTRPAVAGRRRGRPGHMPGSRAKVEYPPRSTWPSWTGRNSSTSAGPDPADGEGGAPGAHLLSLRPRRGVSTNSESPRPSSPRRRPGAGKEVHHGEEEGEGEGAGHRHLRQEG